MSDGLKPDDPVRYSIFTYATEERPSVGFGHTDYFYGRVLKLHKGISSDYDMVEILSVEGESHVVWLREAEKVSLLEVLAGAAALQEPVKLGMPTLALMLARQHLATPKEGTP
jgi:hypothetical protein